MIDDIGKKIYELRTEQSMTLEELGNKVGVGKSTVRKWEKGLIGNMRRDKVVKVAEALGTTPAYLLGWEDKEDKAVLQARFYHRYEELPGLEKAMVRKIMNCDENFYPVEEKNHG